MREMKILGPSNICGAVSVIALAKLLLSKHQWKTEFENYFRYSFKKITSISIEW
jgi:hypothetical protein